MILRPIACRNFFRGFRQSKSRLSINSWLKKQIGLLPFQNQPKRDVQEFLGYPEKNINVVYNGLDKRFLEESRYSKERLKRLYGHVEQIYPVSGNA